MKVDVIVRARNLACDQHGDGKDGPGQKHKGSANWLLAVRLRTAYRLLKLQRGEDIRIRHVKSHTGVRGNEAADKLANMGADIEEGHRVVERGHFQSAEPTGEEHKDNG